MLHQLQAAKIIEALDNGENSSVKGLNQETMLKRSSDTRWSSHYDSLLSLITMSQLQLIFLK